MSDGSTVPEGEMLLHTQGLKKIYDGRTVVNGVDIEVKKGEIVGLLGPNGAGKTTTFYMIVGLVRPDGGSVVFDGKDATLQPMYMRARFGMGYLPQEESIFRRLTVRDNILGVMQTQGYTKQEAEDQTQSLMEKFGIDHVADNLAITLSGGEKRRLTIARSLVTSPKLLMLDEPFSGVDPIAVGEIQEIIRMLRQAGLAILITDHNVRETLNIVDRAYLIFEGKVRRHGTKDFFTRNSDSIKQTIESTTGTMTMLISSIALISLIVGGIGVMNIMLVSVTERTKEIGVRMAIGARQMNILSQFLIEAVLICLLGGFIGIALSGLIGLIFNQFVSSFPMSFSTGSIVLALTCSTLIGVAFGYMPARSASKLNPIDALSHD